MSTTPRSQLGRFIFLPGDKFAAFLLDQVVVEKEFAAPAIVYLVGHLR